MREEKEIKAFLQFMLEKEARLKKHYGDRKLTRIESAQVGDDKSTVCTLKWVLGEEIE